MIHRPWHITWKTSIVSLGISLVWGVIVHVGRQCINLICTQAHEYSINPSQKACTPVQNIHMILYERIDVIHMYMYMVVK